MQVTSPKPIPDKESIELAIEHYLHGCQVPKGAHGQPDREKLVEVLRSYNDNSGFVDLAAGLYEELKRRK